jgi:cephalosporin hydroxylase/predicted O-methyltransferase YrrM
MFPFWDDVVAPVIKAARAKRLIEIGALRGENTVLLLDVLGEDAELHVVDPLPEFDPDQHTRRFPGRYVFHRDLSLNVLSDAGAFDVALIDGDHNWYTVYNELQLLRKASRREDRPLPVLMMHDVCWPYGRRDLYYNPEQIPSEFRQPYARRGIRPGRREVLPAGGMNVALDNATLEGGPRNGVMTALDDFLAELDVPVRVLLIPIYFGLAIVVDERLLGPNPQLRELLDSFESSAGKQQLLELSERIRIDATVFEHNIMRVKDAQLSRSNERYLALLRDALLDRHYLENELRIEYLVRRVAERGAIDRETLRAPASLLPKDLKRLEHARFGGQAPSDDDITASLPYTAMGEAKLLHLDRVLRTIREENITGDFIDCEPGRGGGGVYMRGFLEAYEEADRTVWVAGRFRSARETNDSPAGAEATLVPDLNHVRTAFACFDLLDERVRFLQGPFADALCDAPIEDLSLLRIGAGIGDECRDVLDRLYERLSPGGFVVIDDAGDCDDALEGFRRIRGIKSPTERVGASGLAWRKEANGANETERATPDTRATLNRPPLIPPAPADAIDLSVVVVIFNMKREAVRTLRSLSRSYQRGIEEVDYEVIVVENGSDDGARLGEEFVGSFGREFKYIDLGDIARPSPTDALNRAMKIARGRALALMIDGAHVLTPGVLKFGVAGLRCYEPAIVATQQWYVGPGQQPLVVEEGYGREREDELFEGIDWPSDGYRLFEIGHFIGDRDWFDGLLESNCLFVPRKLLEQIGGFDDSFSMPGGGYANLDLWERLGSSPDVTAVTILGEGSFHQVHGGTTTNDGEHDDRRTKIFGYGQHYQALRGRLLRGPAKPIHYVGNLATDPARRTRSRRVVAPAFSSRRANIGPDGVPSEPERMPDEMRTALIEAFWRGLSWRDTRWLGQPIAAAPGDLLVYQELVASVRPDWIIQTGTTGGGRALYIASICDLIGHGSVISVSDEKCERPEHPRVAYIDAPPHEDASASRVRDLTGESPHAMVLLGSTNGAVRLVQEFNLFAPFVPVGSYVIVENTIVNGHPVWPGYGPGPAEAVKRILAVHGDFVQDTSWEKHALTFNPGGFLRRIT